MKEAQQQLVVEHMPFAQSLARQFHRERMTLGIELEEFQSAAYVGLCEAAHRFSFESGASFKTYCFMRVKGAMLDLLRNGGGILDRSNYRNTVAGSSDEPCRTATEFFRRVGGFEESGYRLRLTPSRKQISLSYADERSPEEITIARKTYEEVVSLVEQLPEKEQQVLRLKYFSNEESGAQKSSRSWVSRLHTRAISLLREEMEVVAEKAA